MSRQPAPPFPAVAAPHLRDHAVRAARGQAPFDWLVTGGQIVDVATGTIRAADLGLVGPLIASVHPPGSRRDAVQALDIDGRFVAPGLIDTHMHIESTMLTPAGFASVVVPKGTTGIVWDPHEFANVFGLDGVRFAIAASKGLPLDVRLLAPSCVPSAPGLETAGAEFGPEEMAQMLGWEEISGVAEVMDMRGVLARSARMAGIVNAGISSGKRVCGHARGLVGPDLQAFLAAGVETDHEITSADDLIAKIEAGMTIELRGSHDYLLPDCVAALRALPIMPQTLTLCTDDVFPDDLVAKGGMNDLLARLVRYGLDPVQALRAATLNAAQTLGARDLGLIGPGKRANLAIFDDLSAFRAAFVFVSGRMVAEQGLLAVPLPETPPPPRTSMLVPEFGAENFEIRAILDGAHRLNIVRSARFTQWSESVVSGRDGRIDLPDDLGIMAVSHRHGKRSPQPALGALADWGRFNGAIATTVAHDSHNLCVFGRDGADMALAANTLRASGGGMAVVQAGCVLAHLPLPIAGLVSDAPPAAVAEGFRAVRAASERVAEWLPPYRVFKAIVGASLACNAGPHVTDLGIADGSTGEFRAAVEAL